MTPTEVAAFMRNYNVWRRGNLDDQPMPDPREIGKAIDAAVAMIDRLESAEKERDELRTELKEVRREVAMTHYTINTLQAKAEEVGRQEPVASVWRCDNGHIHGSCERTLPMGTKLYAPPGAKGE